LYQERINAYFDRPSVLRELEEAILRLASIDSVKGTPAPGKPFGPGPAAALEEALQLCREWGLQTTNYDGYVGLADLNGQKTALHILGHLDVVGPGTGWTVTEPFQPKLVDGMLYGRGVADDKGPIIAALFAMRAVREFQLPLSSNARVVLGTDEESGSADLAYYYAREPYAPFSFSPDASFPLINIEKGQYHPGFGASWAKEDRPVLTLSGGFRANVVPPEAEARLSCVTLEMLTPLCRQLEEATGTRFTLTPLSPDGVRVHCAGKNAHASTPEEGCNALTALLALLAELPLPNCPAVRAVQGLHALFPHGDTAGAALGIAQSDPQSGALTTNLALMELGDSGFQAKMDVRFPLCATEENCRRAAEASFAKYGITVTEDPDLIPAHYVPADSPLVQTLLRCYERYTGVQGAAPLAIGGCTYVHNIPGGVAFGPLMPGFDCNMHGADERIPLDDLRTACKIFTQAIVDLCT